MTEPLTEKIAQAGEAVGDRFLDIEQQIDELVEMALTEISLWRIIGS